MKKLHGIFRRGKKAIKATPIQIHFDELDRRHREELRRYYNLPEPTPETTKDGRKLGR